MQSNTIAAVHELGDGECKTFQFTHNGQQMQGFLIHYHGKFTAYINRCPHTGVNLDWQPNQFLDLHKQYIQCSTHGARFRIDDGFCVYGPCQGQSLTKLDIEIVRGKLRLIV